MHSFQYKILHNILFLNKKICLFGIILLISYLLVQSQQQKHQQHCSGGFIVNFEISHLFLVFLFLPSKQVSISQLCYSNKYDETSLHMFFKCDSTKSSWEQLNKHYHDDLSLPALTPYPVFSDLIKNKLNAQIKNKQIINHILLLLKLYIYKS